VVEMHLYTMPKKQATQRRVFLDYASATPVRDEVVKAMQPFFQSQFVNPAALYKEGVSIRKKVDEARKIIAECIGAHVDEIVFTGSGTEADNLALIGIVRNAKAFIQKPHIIVSRFEHPAVLEAAEFLKKEGVRVSYASINEEGFVSPEEIRKLLTLQTVLVSVMYANNEIGTIQDIRGIARELRHFKKNKKKLKQFPYFHTDGGQAMLFCEKNVTKLGVDLLTLDAAKMYGPKGIGALYIKRGVTIDPVIVGGGQEEGRRSGTENVPGIVGLSTALSLAHAEQEKEAKRLTNLRDLLYKKILAIAPHARLNGSLENRLPNNMNVCFEGTDSEYMVFKLDARGFAVSSSSSCRTLMENNSSYVLQALRKNDPCDTASLRITLGKDTTRDDVINFTKALADALLHP